MLTKFVLIVAIFTYGGAGGNHVAMHDFTSRETCEAAKATILNAQSRFISVLECVER